MTYRMVDLIQKKRDSGEFSQAEIDWMIENYVKGIVPECQHLRWQFILKG